MEMTPLFHFKAMPSYADILLILCYCIQHPSDLALFFFFLTSFFN
jgi:hypothetical protein